MHPSKINLPIHGGKSYGKGKGKLPYAYAKRHRPEAKDPLKNITKPAIRRLFRRAGTKRICGAAYEEVRLMGKDFLQKLLRDSLVYTAHARRQTLTAMDVVFASKRLNRPILGYGG